jgi:hypothetical protein
VVIVMVENDPTSSGARMGWRRLRMPLFVLGVALVVGLLTGFDSLVFLVTGKERVPGETEILSDHAVRVKDPDVFQTKATLNLPDGGILEFRYGPISDSAFNCEDMIG